MKADLHVHTWHSTHSGALRFLRSHDCYSSPVDVYRTARARGMDLVTITDHDSIDGCLELLDRHPDLEDFIVGEEVSCRFPDGDIEVHLGVYGMTEALHRDLQPLRRNVFDVIARLREAGVFFALNHLFHFYRGQTSLESYLRLAHHVSALEGRNGAMLREHNVLIERYAAQGRRWAVVGGSDAHTLRRVGTTWTEVPGAGTADDFMQGLRDGRALLGELTGMRLMVAGEIYGVVGRYMASLAGFGPCEQPPWRRAACLTFSAVSLPFQFIPLVAALRTKAGERAVVRQALRLWEPVFARQDDHDRRSGGGAWVTDRRVAITGIGIVSAVGSTREETWRRMLDGECGIGPVSAFDASGFRSQVAGEVDMSTITDGFSRLEWRRWSRADRLGVVAADEALADSGVLDSGIDRTRVGVMLGAGTADLIRNETYFFRAITDGVGRARPSDAWNHFSNTPGDVIAGRHGLEGQRSCVVAACSSSTIAIGQAADAIRLGRVDAVVAGGTDALARLTYSGFNALRLMDSAPCRPFDRSPYRDEYRRRRSHADSGINGSCPAPRRADLRGACRLRLVL